MSQTDNSVIPFAPTDKGNDQLDKAGHSILNLLQKASGVAEKNSQQALDMAQKLSHQLRAARNRATRQLDVFGAYSVPADFLRKIRRSKQAAQRNYHANE